MPVCSAAPRARLRERPPEPGGAGAQAQYAARLGEGAQIILLAARGVGVRPSAVRLGAGRATVQRWRRRCSSSATTMSVLGRLIDAPRPGTPATFSPEQICAILALACEVPQRDGRELTRGDPR